MNKKYYETTLEPMQMLQAYRTGQPVINHVFRPQAQFLPQGLPSFTPPPMVPQNPYLFPAPGQQQLSGGRLQNGFVGGGPGGDGAPGGVGTDGGADGSGGAGGGGK